MINSILNFSTTHRCYRIGSITGSFAAVLTHALTEAFKSEWSVKGKTVFANGKKTLVTGSSSANSIIAALSQH